MVSKSVARGLERAHSYSMSSNPSDWEKARIIRTNIDLADMIRQTKVKRKKKVDEVYSGYYGSKEEREDKDHDQRDRERKLRMKHGKRWKEFTRDVEAAKKRLRPGEVRTFNKKTGKWESNKD